MVRRWLWWDAASAAYAGAALNFPGLRLLLRVDSEVRVAGELARQETRYFAASVPAREGAADEVLGWVRGHWGVENRLHFIKDRWWDEDRHYLSRPGLAERFAVLTGAALAVLRLTRQDPKLPLRAWADELSGDVQQALKLLTEEIL